MTTTQRTIVQRNNDETLQATIMDHDSAPSDNVINITGMQLDFYIKSDQQTPNTDPSTVHLSTATGEITLTDPTHGVARIFVARAHLQNAGDLWYQLDVLSGGQLKTAGNGTLTVVA